MHHVCSRGVVWGWGTTHDRAPARPQELCQKLASEIVNAVHEKLKPGVQNILFSMSLGRARLLLACFLH